MTSSARSFERYGRRLRLPEPPRFGRVATVVVVGAIWVVIAALALPSDLPIRTGLEAFCYWSATLLDPYARSEWTTPGAYVYSPAFLQLVAPLTWLPWPAFLATWTGVLLLALRSLTGARWFAIGAIFATIELVGGNISLLLGAAIVFGFRWPALWSFVLLTKVTPGIGLLWFVVRREWRSLGWALGATAAIALGSFVLMPTAWPAWIEVLVASAGRDGTWAAVPIPLIARLPAAIALVIWGAATGRRWTVPAASMLALPALWYGSLTMLLAVIALREPSPQVGQATDHPLPAPG
ncbi:MAG: glycosyltransferase family 87 protein [Candidatus Limnocylindrales bacterium]